MNINNYNFGYIPSKPDARNYGISRLIAPVNVFPEEFELDISRINVENQGNIGCCVAEAGCYHLAYTNNDLFSVGFMYGNRDTEEYHGIGMQPQQMLAHLKNEGNVLRREFLELAEIPEIETDVLRVKQTLLPKAAPYKIASYAQLHTATDIKNAIMQLKSPVLLCIDVYETFFMPDSTGFVSAPIPAIMDQSYGGHAITVYGWDKRGFKILNSWGAGHWTADGKCVLDYNYPMTEAWGITDRILPQPPQPTPVNQWYRVQVGAFGIVTNAQNMASKLKTMGYNTYIVKVDNLYKVQVGAFGVQANAQRLSAELNSRGISNFIVLY